MIAPQPNGHVQRSYDEKQSKRLKFQVEVVVSIGYKTITNASIETHRDMCITRKHANGKPEGSK